MSVAESIAQRVQAMVHTAEAEGPADADSASEAPDGSPPTVEATGAESASADASSASEGTPTAEAGSASPEATIDPETKLRHQLLEEKLAIAREERARVREEQAAAKRAREEAEEDRRAAAEERKRYEELKKKPWRERIEAEGLKPADIFEQMRAEALKEGTPEAKIEALQAAHEAELRAIREEFKTFRESLESEKAAAAKAQADAVFSTQFEQASSMPQWASLSKEYPKPVLRKIVEGLRDNPDRVIAQAQELGLNLTAPDGRINMGHIFVVLKATQDAHLARMRALEAPQEQATQAPVDAKTVNGTTDRRNAGSALGNTVATERATDAKPRTTRRERVQRMIRSG